jgi:hypothetical protein
MMDRVLFTTEENMRLVAWSIAAGLAACSLGAAAKDQYSLREDVPETGSNIQKEVLSWPVPPDATYEELTPDQKQTVRSEYLNMGANDEPPYPLYGVGVVLRDVQKMRRSNIPVTGKIHFAVGVDSAGNPQGVAVLASPDTQLSKAVAFSLMHAKYKPAKCSGRPCNGEFSFYYDFQHNYPTGMVMTDWPVFMWADRRLQSP